jgi:peroxiredoxin
MVKQSLKYFQTGLENIGSILLDKTGVLIMTGHDFMRRNVILVVQNDSILYKQISNYDIKGLVLANP